MRRIQGTNNIFRPLIQFESFLKSGGRKPLSRVYSILFSLTKVEDGVRKRWETVRKKHILDSLAISDNVFLLMWQSVKIMMKYYTSGI